MYRRVQLSASLSSFRGINQHRAAAAEAAAIIAEVAGVDPGSDGPRPENDVNVTSRISSPRKKTANADSDQLSERFLA